MKSWVLASLTRFRLPVASSSFALKRYSLKHARNVASQTLSNTRVLRRTSWLYFSTESFYEAVFTFAFARTIVLHRTIDDGLDSALGL